MKQLTSFTILGEPNAQKRHQRVRKTKNDIIQDKGSCLILDISTTKHPAATMMVDKDDWVFLTGLGIGRAIAFNRDRRRGKGLYAVARVSGELKYIHRLLMPDARIVDHIDGNGTNNTRSNLRAASFLGNARNCGLSKSNRSGVAGVRFLEKTGNWHARIMVNRKEINLGRYATKEAATAARRKAEKKYFGEFAPNWEIR